MSEQEGKQVWTGPCVGGPMSWPGNSVQGESRFPKGFLLVDKPNMLVWVYTRDQWTGTFFVESEQPTPITREELRAHRDNNQYDIRSAEEEVSRVYSRTTDADQDR